jgi:3-methyladenine DNA glycosylase AlkC
LKYSRSDDIYIRKKVSHIIGKSYHKHPELQRKILNLINKLIVKENEKVRQTCIYSLGEIGTKDADVVFEYFSDALGDSHHKVRNSVMSSLKIMGQKNPKPTFKFVEKFLNDPNPDIRKKVIHGIELRGRNHPEEVLPILKKVQYEDDNSVRKMIMHVLGQISYKSGCLEKVTAELVTWENQELVSDTIPYIIEVHKKYPFSAKNPEEAEIYLKKHFKNIKDK